MAKPYSVDLRGRVLEAVRANVPIKEITQTFKVNRKTIYDWRRQYEKAGTLEPKKAEKKGPSPKINDMEKFKEFVDNNVSKTQKEMGEIWGVSASTICSAIRKIGHTFKKKHTDTQSAKKKKGKNF